MADHERKTSDPRTGWIPAAAVLVVAILFGLFIVPRLSTGLEGKRAPDFALPVMFGGDAGARVRLSEQRGKLVIVDFWASWCKPCREQTQVLESLKKRYAHLGLVVLGVNVSDSPTGARSYLQQVKPSWVVVEDVEGAANAAYQVETLPTLVAVDRAGNVFAVRRRFVPERELAAMIEAMAD